MGFQLISWSSHLKRGRLWGICAGVMLCFRAAAHPALDTSNATLFFTTVADKLLRNTFSFGITNIPVSTNGVLVYSPAAQRLLQVSANLYDASVTNFYPTVFRPMFYSDGSGNVFITGYQQVSSVSGPGDSQLSQPIDISAVPAGFSTNLNIYGVPWIIGAKKGFPNFNQFSMRNAVQLTRKLQVTRTDVNRAGATATNEMFIMGITNQMGFSFWNSYYSNYNGNLTLYLKDVVAMTLTNGAKIWFTNFSLGITPTSFVTNISMWPGSAWNGYSGPEYQLPVPESFITALYDVSSLPLAQYRYSTATFVPASQAVWETGLPGPPIFPQFGLMTTNWLQAYILDGSNVIDYVEFSGPNSALNVNGEINDPNENGTHYYMWSTNAYGLGNSGSTPTWGVANQIRVSRQPSLFSGITWTAPPDMPLVFNTIALQGQFFDAFFTGAGISRNGTIYHNTNLVQQAPYSPTRTAWDYTLWQANDPLVHYLASDLSCTTHNTGFGRTDNLATTVMPGAALNTVGERYQPWGRNQQMAFLGDFTVDTDQYNSRYRDPLVWGSDFWNFPTGPNLPLTSIGRIHRGTPWQTIYLKQRDVLLEYTMSPEGMSYIGTNTWMQWTGDLDANDAPLSAPTRDWQALGVLLPLLNTNNPTQLISVNDSNPADWTNLLNNLNVLTNSTFFPESGIVPTFDFFTMTGDSPQAALIVGAIADTRASQPNQKFQSLGDILQTPALSEYSPWLNRADDSQTAYGITDEAYEMIPSQLLPLLRMDSLGAILPNSGTWNLQFSGMDTYAYALQTSTDLIHWQIVSTNYPSQGIFTVPISPASDSQNHFYRSILLP